MGERRLKSHNVRINNNRLSDAYGLYLDIRACLSVYNPSGAIYNNCIARRLADFCDERICVMAKSMIDEIRLAEQTAAKTVNDAQAAAQSKIDSAKAQAQALSHEMIAEAKAHAQTVIATAENNAYKKRSKATADNAQSTDKFIASVRNNFDKAVKTVVDEIIPG